MTAALQVLIAAGCTADSCCGTTEVQDAYKVMQGYHMECHDEDTPAAVEEAIHTYEEPCEDFGECNTLASLVADYDPMECHEEDDHHNDNEDESYCRSDQDQDGIVDVNDILAVLGAFNVITSSCHF